MKLTFSNKKLKMNKLFNIIFTSIVIISLTSSVVAQEVNEVTVEVSKEKTVIQGKAFYLHTVKKGENIYRISKAYNVTQKDIIIANPEAISGSIKDGQVLKIPADPGAPRNIQQIESDNFIYHVAEDKQTVYFLTQKYKITEKELYKYNPELEFSPLQAGQLVKIPKTPNAPVGSEKFKPIERYVEYKVGKKETKYSIAKENNITVDELIRANPILNSEDLQKGQVLQIPVKSETEIVTVPIVNKPDTAKLAPETKKQSPCDTYKPFSEPIRVAMLFPFFLEGMETLAMIDSANNEKRNLETNETFQITSNLMEFYEGALMAVDSLKRAGLSVKIFTYDTGKENQKLSTILALPEMAKMDLIIGPYTKHTLAVEKTAQFARKNKIKMVSPVATDTKSLTDNPYVFQVNAEESVSAEKVAKYISTFPNKNVILIYSNQIADKEVFDTYKNKLTEILPNQFKVYDYTDKNNLKKLAPLLVNHVDNIVIIPSEQLAIIQNLLNFLNFSPQNYSAQNTSPQNTSSQNSSIEVFGLPSWTIFKSLLDQEYLHNLEFQYATPFYIDFSNNQVQNFLTNYKLFYKSAPTYHVKDNSPQFYSKEGYSPAFLGYDVTFYFLNSMGRMGKNFENCLGQQKMDLLHTNIIFDRIAPDGGFLNKGVNIIKYTKDYYITKVN
jgi:LysM repeat protein